jgi:hypothetical protein
MEVYHYDNCHRIELSENFISLERNCIAITIVSLVRVLQWNSLRKLVIFHSMEDPSKVFTERYQEARIEKNNGHMSIIICYPCFLISFS